ncbi:MAG TPA: HlyD family secretion protein [Acetobacteraceae bacterium]|jgi:membrane fusion protein (multidrug efflux system)|nr:HlyD family secretion protein [Acetobacteraceae bacterium]
MNEQSVGPEMRVEHGSDAPKLPFLQTSPRRAFPWLATTLRLFVLFLIGALIMFVYYEWDYWIGWATEQTTDDAYLQSDLTPLAAHVPGYVAHILVHDYETVKTGQLLIQLDDRDYRAQLAQAQGAVDSAEAALATIAQQRILQGALIAQAQASIEGSKADVTRYHLETIRQKTLLASRIAGTQQIVEQAVDNERKADATLALNQAQLQQQEQQVNVLNSQEAQARATLAAQQAARDLAAINLGYTRITSPVDGMAGLRLVQEGQYLSVGTQVISVVPLPHVWVLANYKETQMTRVRVGQPATVTVDAFPGVVLHGHVQSWAPASGSQFSLLPPDNATGNFTKVVQRITVKILLDPNPAVDDLLRPGMSVIPTIDTK